MGDEEVGTMTWRTERVAGKGCQLNAASVRTGIWAKLILLMSMNV